MKLARVIGRVVLSKKDEALAGGFLLIAAPLDREQIADLKNSAVSKKQSNFVLYDNLGAAQGDIISYVDGAEATAPFDRPIPIDAYNVGILDRLNYKPQA